MQKDEEMEEQTSLPIKYEKTVDKEGCVTIPYWINIYPGKKYLFNIYNKNSSILYSNLEKEIRIRRGNKGEYFFVGTKSEIFKARDTLEITILEQIFDDISAIYSSEILDEEKDKFFPTRFCRIIFLYSIENQKIIHSYEDEDTLSQTHPDLLDLEYIGDSFQILEENGGVLPKDDHIIYNITENFIVNVTLDMISKSSWEGECNFQEFESGEYFTVIIFEFGKQFTKSHPSNILYYKKTNTFFNIIMIVSFVTIISIFSLYIISKKKWR